MLTGAVLAAGMLTACDDDKQLTLNAPEARMLESIKIECSETLKLAVGMDSTLVYTYGPQDVTDPRVYFKSADESIATVDENGTVHAVGVGETTVTALSALGFKVYDAEAVLKISVIPELIKATQVNITCETAPSEEGYYYVTDEIQLSAEILPENHTYDVIKWVSSDENVATVNSDGLVTALKPGDVTIKAIAMDKSNSFGSIDFHFYELVDAERTEIKPLDGPVCITNGTFDLDVTYFPAGATIGAVKWESDDETVCKVTRGRVTPVGFGTCNITATCPSTGDMQTVQVTVEPGWYVWDASNKFGRWYAGSNAQFIYEPDCLRVKMSEMSAGGQWRGDLVLVNDKNNPAQFHFGEYPVIAMRCTIPADGRNTLDGVSVDGVNAGNPQCNEGRYNQGDPITLADGTKLIYIDVAKRTKYSTTGYTDMSLLQFKIADIPAANVADDKMYTVYWIRTFRSIDEMKTFAEAEIANGK